jgi:antibiotic biosynthesis monooxygenase (ABM) superfamily enzyme
MDRGSRDGVHASKEVIFVVSRNIKAGCEKEYDDWLRRYLILEKKVPGYIGTTIIMQGGSNSVVKHNSQIYRQGLAGCMGKFGTISS